MPWVDLFREQFNTPNTVLQVGAGEAWASFLYQSFPDPAVSQVLYTTCEDRVYFHAEDGEGNCTITNHLSYFGNVEWQSFVHAIYPFDDSDFTLVGRRIRARARFTGEYGQAEPYLDGAGSAGFVFSADSGGGFYVDTEIAAFNDTAYWGGSPTLGEWGPWAEHSVIESDTTPAGAHTFFGIGHVGHSGCSFPPGQFMEFQWQIWVDGPPPDGFHVYELDRGWSFDGAYIPHYIEMNWYFGDDPIHYHSVQKIRIHGMSKGLAQLTVATNGMQTDYERDFSEPQVVDLPRNPKHISTELIPETNYTDSANRGLSIQMKFEGRNRDLTRPEPQHVLQVLAVQSSPAGTGSRSN